MRPTRGIGAPSPEVTNGPGLDLAEVPRPPAESTQPNRVVEFPAPTLLTLESSSGQSVLRSGLRKPEEAVR